MSVQLCVSYILLFWGQSLWCYQAKVWADYILEWFTRLSYKGRDTIWILFISASCPNIAFTQWLWNAWYDVDQTKGAVKRAGLDVFTAHDIMCAHTCEWCWKLCFIFNHTPRLVFCAFQIAELFITEKNCILSWKKVSLSRFLLSLSHKQVAL